MTPAVGYGKGAFVIYDTEKLCGAPGGMGGTQYDVATDLTGVNTQGGVPISAFFKGLFTSTGPITAVYFHVQHTDMVNFSVAGVETEELK